MSSLLVAATIAAIVGSALIGGIFFAFSNFIMKALVRVPSSEGMLAMQTINPAMLIRRCVGCGYDGALLDGGRAPRCARCGCDLARRPARSYAEMEGLLPHQRRAESRRASGPIGLDRLEHRTSVQRWLAFLFLLVVAGAALMCLASAALP